MENPHIVFAPDIMLNIVTLAETIDRQFVVLFVGFPELLIVLQLFVMRWVNLNPPAVIVTVEEHTFEYLGIGDKVDPDTGRLAGSPGDKIFFTIVGELMPGSRRSLQAAADGPGPGFFDSHPLSLILIVDEFVSYPEIHPGGVAGTGLVAFDCLQQEIFGKFNIVED